MADDRSNQPLLDRMVIAVEKVRDRLLRAAAALEKSRVPYAVIGGNAVAAWVATVDSSAVRNTQDVDILLRRADLQAATRALEEIGFVRRHVKGLDIFLDGPEARVRDAVHVVYACEKVRPDSTVTSPDVLEGEQTGQFRLIGLEPLVRMKLDAWRDKDRTHLRDLLEVGLIDASWVGRLGPILGPRLKQLIDSPEC